MSKDNVYKYPDQDVMNVLLKGMTIFCLVDIIQFIQLKVN